MSAAAEDVVEEPAKMRIDARIDTHGNPMIHDPNDPAAAQDGSRAAGP